MVTYRIRKMIAWGMAVTMTAGMTNVLTGCGAEREGQAVEKICRSTCYVRLVCQLFLVCNTVGRECSLSKDYRGDRSKY